MPICASGWRAARRCAEIDDVAGAVEFLLGPGARDITRTVVTVNAGSSL